MIFRLRTLLIGAGVAVVVAAAANFATTVVVPIVQAEVSTATIVDSDLARTNAAADRLLRGVPASYLADARLRATPFTALAKQREADEQQEEAQYVIAAARTNSATSRATLLAAPVESREAWARMKADRAAHGRLALAKVYATTCNATKVPDPHPDFIVGFMDKDGTVAAAAARVAADHCR